MEVLRRLSLVCSLLPSPCRQLRFSTLESTLLEYLCDSFSAAKELLESGAFCFFVGYFLTKCLEVTSDRSAEEIQDGKLHSV